MHRFVHKASACLLSLGLCGLTQAADINTRQVLDEAIESVRAEGYRISWSDALVRPWMRGP